MWQCWASKYELHSPHNRMTGLRDTLLSCVFMGDRNQEGKKRQRVKRHVRVVRVLERSQESQRSVRGNNFGGNQCSGKEWWWPERRGLLRGHKKGFNGGLGLHHYCCFNLTRGSSCESLLLINVLSCWRGWFTKQYIFFSAILVMGWKTLCSK